jgi:hypothetical protein
MFFVQVISWWDAPAWAFASQAECWTQPKTLFRERNSALGRAFAVAAALGLEKTLGPAPPPLDSDSEQLREFSPTTTAWAEFR